LGHYATLGTAPLLYALPPKADTGADIADFR
jgi:hypothetical protein